MPQSVKCQRRGLWSNGLIQRRGDLTPRLTRSWLITFAYRSPHIYASQGQNISRDGKQMRDGRPSPQTNPPPIVRCSSRLLTEESRKRHMRTLPATIDADLFPPA